MQITIAYDSSWRNSFLDGDNNEPVPIKGRKYKASITSLKQEANFLKRKVTLDTTMGVLNRLIGDQRKLYQSRNDLAYYFKEIENKITYVDSEKETQEMTYLRNISGSTDQGSFTGAIKANDPMFKSDYSLEFWGVLGLSFAEICEFILNKQNLVNKNISLNPISLVERIELLSKEKNIVNTGVVTSVVDELNRNFLDIITDKLPSPFVEKSGEVKPIRFYSAALYLQLERLDKKFDMESAKTKSGKVAGFSKRGFNGKRDFIKNFVTGGEKKIWGNPYIHETFVKGEGKTRSLMTKASGKLEITIDISKEKAKEIRAMIHSASVSSFYLGKKGLAYVEDIKIAEVEK